MSDMLCICNHIVSATQVFYRGNDKPVFFVANRGHHADIGGKTPGMCNCVSKRLLHTYSVCPTLYKAGAICKLVVC